LGPQI